MFHVMVTIQVKMVARRMMDMFWCSFTIPTNRTDFCVLDVQNIEVGPVARIKLKHHVPYGFHGTFSPRCH